MRVLATILLSALFVFTAHSQQTKPKTAPAKPKSADTKSKSTTSKQKTGDSKSKPSASKPKPSASKTKTTAAKTVTKPKVIVPKKPDENAEWQKAIAATDAAERIAALRKFVEAFPESTKIAEASETVAIAQAALGNEKLQAGDTAAAAEFFKAAVGSSPVPLPERLFSETLSKFPANLYFRGLRVEAIEIAKALETKSATNAPQTLGIATFYMSIENGSEAKRLAENAIKLDAASSAAYQTLGLANRIDFQLEESATAYAKAIELEPGSLTARRGLAEMKRSLGKSDEAAALYREILGADAANVPAQTGLVLSLFDAGKRSEAEAEMAKSLETSPGNVILLAGAAYWYAVQNEGEKAVEVAQKAIASDPRFIWSHVALARGHMSRRDPIAAEKTLLAARRYGNFPTLEYEIASARLAAGYYREAAEELAKSFSVKNGVIYANIGGRVPKDSRNFAELVGFERRASIFAPTAADSPENAARLTALLELKQELDSPQPRSEIAARAADEFVKGDDKMKLHRQIFTATRLLEKKVSLPKVVELAKAAAGNIDAGLDVPQPSVAVMAAELYENRSLASIRGEYVNVPDLPRSTLSAILRGRIEEISGWAALETYDATEAVIRLKRAVSVLPVDSAWWRTSTWRLGSAMARAGKDADALDWYIRSYKSSGPSSISYGVIETLYKNVNGNLDGLETRIGKNPVLAPSAETIAKNLEPFPTPEAKPEPTPERTPFRPRRDIIPASVPVATPAIVKPEPTPAATPEEVKPQPTPVATPEEVKPTPSPESIPIVAPSVNPTVEPTPEPTPTPEEVRPTPERVPEPTPDTTPVAIPSETPPPTTPDPTPTSSPENAQPTLVPETSPQPTPDPSLVATNTEPKAEPTPLAIFEEKTVPKKPVVSPPPADNKTGTKPAGAAKELFPAVVITIPTNETTKLETEENAAATEAAPEAAKQTNEPKPENSRVVVSQFPQNPPVTGTGRPRFAEFKTTTRRELIEPCKFIVSEDNLTIRNGGGGLAVVVGLENDGDLEGLTALSTSPEDVSVRREIIAGVKSRALFVVSSKTARTGVFQVKFELPCGEREIVVRVRQE